MRSNPLEAARGKCAGSKETEVIEVVASPDELVVELGSVNASK